MKRVISIIVFFIPVLFLLSQSWGFRNKTSSISKTTIPCFRIMFYNTENFFDTIDDPKTNDNEFLPDAKRHWTSKRYYTKLNRLYKTIISIGIQPPSIVGLCEIENDRVLHDIVKNTPLIKFNYHFIHHDSPDKRGIDVALLYRPDLFKPLKNEFIAIHFPFDTALRTREILYSKGIALQSDTIHVFVNHWPSRTGGEYRSEPLRNFVAKTLRYKVDSLFAINAATKIIIIGDMNDEPDNASISKYLNAKKTDQPILQGILYNLSERWLGNTALIGTIKYQGNWYIFDQVIVSGSILKPLKGLSCNLNAANIYFPDFLLTNDKKYSGKMPFRTYNGYKYAGGFSDHLPVFFDLCTTNIKNNL